MKKFRSLILLLIAICVLLSPLSTADGSSIRFKDWKKLPTKVDAHKVWTVSFSQELDASTTNSENIYIHNEDGERVTVDLKLSENGRSVQVFAPKEGYVPGHRYTLYIKEVRSVKGTVLKENIRMDFYVAGNISKRDFRLRDGAVILNVSEDGVTVVSDSPNPVIELDNALIREKKIEKGTALLIPSGSSSAYGLSGEVVSIEKGETRSSITLKEIPFYDLYREVHLSGYFDEFEKPQTAREIEGLSFHAQTVEGSGVKYRRVTLKFDNTPVIRNEAGELQWSTQNTTSSVSQNSPFPISKGKLSGEMVIDLPGLEGLIGYRDAELLRRQSVGLEDFRWSINPRISSNLHLELPENVDVSETQKFEQIPLMKIHLPIPGLSADVTIQPSVKSTGKSAGNGKVDIRYAGGFRAGIEKKGQEITSNFKNSNTEHHLEFAPEVNMSAVGEMNVDFEISLHFAKKKPEMSINTQLGCHSDLNVEMRKKEPPVLNSKGEIIWEKIDQSLFHHFSASVRSAALPWIETVKIPEIKTSPEKVSVQGMDRLEKVYFSKSEISLSKESKLEAFATFGSYFDGKRSEEEKKFRILPIGESFQPSETAKYLHLTVVPSNALEVDLNTGKVNVLNHSVKTAKVTLEFLGQTAECTVQMASSPTQEADKTELRQWIKKAETYDLNQYTEQSAKGLTEALTHAKKIADKKDATEGEVSNAVNRLKSAIKGLERRPAGVDKTELRQWIKKAETYDLNQYTEQSAKGLTEALTHAKKIADKKDASEGEVSNAVNRLKSAIKGLERRPAGVDKTELRRLIQEAESYDLNQYTEQSAKGLTEALTHAKKVADKKDATEAEVSDAVNRLKSAIKGLERRPVGVDKTELRRLIQQAEAYDLRNYTQESADRLRAALSDARAVEAKDSASREEVSDAVKKLEEAIGKLEPLKADAELTVFKPSGSEGYYWNVVAADETGNVISFNTKKNDYGMTLKFAKLPYGEYTLQPKDPKYFIYEPKIEVRTPLFSKDLYAYRKASLQIVSHGYGQEKPEYSVYLNEMDSSWTYQRLVFQPDSVPQTKGLKVRLVNYDRDNYIVKETEKTVDVVSDSAVVGFYFTKKQNVVKVSSFDKLKVSAKLDKRQVIERLPVIGKLTLEDGTEREVALTWETDAFVENQEGTVRFRGTYPEQKDLKNVMEFAIEVERLGENTTETLIESIDPVAPVEVKFGTSAEELRTLLPKILRVKLNKSAEKKEVPVEWILTDYDSEKPGTYHFKGSYRIEGVQDYPTVTVEVRLKEKELPLTEEDFVFKKKDGRVILTDTKASGKAKIKKSKKLVIPSTYQGEPVMELGSTACQWLDFEEVEIPNTVEVIGYKALGYGRLSSLTIPDSVRQIGGLAFSARSDAKEPRIKEVKMSANIEKIDDAAFGWAGFSEIEVPETLKELHQDAFYKAKGHPETQRVHVYVKGFTNPNRLKDGKTHLINPAKVTFEYRYKGQLLGTSKASYRYKDKYYHINEELTVKPEGIPSGYEPKTTEVRVLPNAKEYVCVVELIRPGERIVAKEVVHQFKNLEVPFGTDKEALKQKLPTTVTVIDSQGTEHIVPVGWYFGSYDGTKPSVYKIRASFSLPQGVEQDPKAPVALEHWIQVTVKAEEMERSISIEFSFSGHVGIPELYAVDEFGKEYVLKPNGGASQYSAKVPKGAFTVRARNISEGWVSVPPFLSVNTVHQNATGILSLEKGVQLKVKAVDEKGTEVPNVVFKTLVPVLDPATWSTSEYEYGTLIPSSLDASDSVKVMIREVPDGYRAVGENQKVIKFSEVGNEVVFRLQKIADLLEVTQNCRIIHIRIHQNGEGGNFVIRDASGRLVYVGVLEGTERSLSLHLEEEEVGEYFIYVNVDGVLKKKFVRLQ